MCDCCRQGREPDCPCWCHWPRGLVLTRSGKATMLALMVARAEFRRDHPNGVVAGQVVTDAGEVEA